MTKRLKSKHKVDRRLKANIWGRPKSPFNSRAYPPGQHGQNKKGKPTDYGIQLQAKQKLKAYYGNINERQFRNIYRKALSKRGDTTENLIALLESRLDNVVYRLGFSPTRPAARQLVSHKHFLVNGIAVNIPSYTLKPGDTISVRDRSKKMDIILNSIRTIKGDIDLSWLELDKAKMTGIFLNVPERDQMNLTVNEQLVVELYSK